LKAKQQAGAKSMEVRKELHDEYNNWMMGRFPLFSWGGATCNSYYATAEGKAPFLFPGDYKAWEKLHEEMGISEFDLG
jgi:cyclohexanone monooxygenase